MLFDGIMGIVTERSKTNRLLQLIASGSINANGLLSLLFWLANVFKGLKKINQSKEIVDLRDKSNGGNISKINVHQNYSVYFPIPFHSGTPACFHQMSCFIYCFLFCFSFKLWPLSFAELHCFHQIRFYGSLTSHSFICNLILIISLCTPSTYYFILEAYFYNQFKLILDLIF